MTRREALLTTLALNDRGMVRMAGGTFHVGVDKRLLLAWFPNAGPGLKAMLATEMPRHKVTIPAFWIDRHEVTNGDFQKFVRAEHKWGKTTVGGGYLQHWKFNDYPEGQADYPVVHVTWDAALAYAIWAGKRLPAEAEWEFAASGGQDGIKYPWGNQDPGPSLANYSESRIKAPVRVGNYPPNRNGLFDLAGNVWEFCLDRWPSPYPSHSVELSEADISAMSKAQAGRRVIRGGSYDGGAFNLRVTARDSHAVDNPVGHVGFRCAMSA